MKKLFGMALAFGVIWALGCKSTISQNAGGTVERLPVMENIPKAKEASATGIQQTAASGLSSDVVPAILTTPATGGECSH